MWFLELILANLLSLIIYLAERGGGVAFILKVIQLTVKTYSLPHRSWSTIRII